MALFGSSPGIGGGMFPNDNPFGVPDYMSGINDAFAQNAALGQQKPKNGIGEFLRILAGTFGDNLTGNPVFSQHQKGKIDAEEANRNEQAQKDWWYEQQRYKAQNEKPDLPGLIDEFTTAQSLGMVPPDMKYTDYVALKNPGISAPVVLPYEAERVDGGNAALPQISSEAEYNALPPGASYRDPNGRLRRKGGPSPQGSGGFPR